MRRQNISLISALIGQDYAFEARLVAGSDLLMSAQYGQQTNVMMCLICYFEYHLGNTVSLAIEMASSDLVPQHVWDEFKVCARYSDYSTCYGYPADCPGQQLAELQRQ